MLKIAGYIIGAIVGLGILGTIGFYVRAQTVEAPDNVNNSSIDPCPETPNCVSTLNTDDLHGMDPISYTGTQAEAREQLLEILRGLPRTTIVTEEENYIYAVSRSPTMGFPDDVEFVFDDEAKVINFRSAARMGQSDMNKNRERMEEVQRQFGG